MISKVEKMDIHKLPKQQIDIKKNDLDSSKHNADRSGLSFTKLAGLNVRWAPTGQTMGYGHGSKLILYQHG